MGQKANLSVSNLSLVVRPSSLVHRLTSVILCVFESLWLKQNAVLISAKKVRVNQYLCQSASEKFVSIRVNSWLIAIKIFIENTKGIWYNTNNWGRPPKRGCGEPHAKEQQFQSNIVVSSFILRINEWSITLERSLPRRLYGGRKPLRGITNEPFNQ